MAKGIPIKTSEIRRIRQELVMTQQQMAQAMGISFSGMQRLEKDAHIKVMPRTIHRLAKLLKQKPTDLVKVLIDHAA